MGQQYMYKIGFFNPTNCFKSKPSQTKQYSKRNNSSSSPQSSSYSSFHSRTATVTRNINHFEPCSPKVSCMGSVKSEKTSSTSSSSQSSKSTGEDSYFLVRGNNFGGSWKVGDESDLVVKVFLVEELDPPLPVVVKPLGTRPVCLWRRRRHNVALEKIQVVKEEFKCVLI